MRSQPLNVTIWAPGELQRLIRGWEKGILEEGTAGHAAIPYSLVILHFGIGSQVRARFSQLQTELSISY